MLSRIGQYEVVGLLAIGGEGREVLLAKSPSGAPVAIKKRPPTAARSLSQARHPNLVDVIEIVAVGNDLYTVMEYLEGERLSGLLRRLIKRHERIATGLAAHMIAEICDGLHAAPPAGALAAGALVARPVVTGAAIANAPKTSTTPTPAITFRIFISRRAAA